MTKKKKNWYLYRLLLIVALSTANNTLVGAGPLDDLFKGFDFDAFLKDMEDVFDKSADDKAFGAKAPTMAAAGEKTVITTTTTGKKKTRDELFITPDIQTVQEKGKAAETLLTQESLNAFKEVMYEFITLIVSIQNIVDGSSAFSLPFKEQFAQFHEAIDKIAIAYGVMVSKKLYSTIMPYQKPPDPKAPAAKAPTPKAAQPAANLRQRILDLIKELHTLEKDLKKLVTQEEKVADEQALAAFARRSHKTKLDITPTAKKHKKRRRLSAN